MKFLFSFLLLVPGCGIAAPQATPPAAMQAAPPAAMQAAPQAAMRGRLSFEKQGGVKLESGRVTLRLDSNEQEAAPVVRFGAGGLPQPLQNPIVTVPRAGALRLVYHLTAPGGVDVEIRRNLTLRREKGGVALVENFKLTPAKPLSLYVEIERPFSTLSSAPASGKGFSVTWPLQNGWAKNVALTGRASGGEYRLGHVLSDAQTPQLALPLAQITSGAQQIALVSDPLFGTLFSLRSTPTGVVGTLRYAYAGGLVPVKSETRSFGVWIPDAPEKDAQKAMPGAVDAFFRLMLPDVPPAPQWTRGIKMVGYDFLSDGGQGWERDIKALAASLTPAERRRVALCFHGWYDGLGSYSFDEKTGRMKQSWVAFERTRKVPFTQDEVKRRLRVARDAGFRVLMYFADGMLADTGVAGYRADWELKNAAGVAITGWQGPDTFGPTHALNPAHPEVIRHYNRYLQAMLETFGSEVDGFVWDETFYVRIGQIAAAPTPAYADRAMLRLVAQLRAKVKKMDAQKVFLTSDCIGLFGWTDIPASALFSDGTYQDSHANPVAWSYALFPNWRNSVWSCNWSPISKFGWTRWGVENFGTPVAISNGWEDDKGPSEWDEAQRTQFLQLFRENVRAPARVRMLTDDPAKMLANAPR